MQVNIDKVEYEIVARRKTVKPNLANIYKTEPRPQTKELDIFPYTDRTLIDYNQYHKYIGHAGVKYSMAIQATRGCPYKCFYCDIYKTSENHNRRSTKHFFNEVRRLADIGVKRFEFIDDIFNVNRKSCKEFFELVIKHNLNVKFFFPTGLKGDLLDQELIDLMVEGGSIGLNLSLEHASPRMQKIMRKGLNVEKFHDVLTYITNKYPEVNLTLNAMHGFPTETEEEAMMTLNFIKSIKWIDFPYLHNVRIFPGTELEHFALEAGIPKEMIKESQDMSYHELSPTLPFSTKFTMAVRTSFVQEYVFNKERLMSRLPYQMMHFTEDELNQKYNSYFPTPKIKSFNDFLDYAKIDRNKLEVRECLDEDSVRIPKLKSRLKNLFPKKNSTKQKNRFKLFLIDLSTYFSSDSDSRQYNVLEPPLGLMALETFLETKLKDNIEINITKSLIDFDSFKELLDLIVEFKPDLIGIRAMTFYSGFFHEGVAYLRDMGIKTPIIAGGPYPTASYHDILKDKNIDVCAIAEGEFTLLEFINAMIENGKQLPNFKALKKIKGIAFSHENNTNASEGIASIPVSGIIPETINKV